MGWYVTKAATAWFLGFFPFFEIYLAIPAAVAMGLDPVSALVWPTLGNLTPLIAVPQCSAWIQRHAHIRAWLDGLVNDKWEYRFNRWGKWFLLFATPWVGVWATAAAAMSLKIRGHTIVLWSTVSIVIYAFLTLLVSMGVYDLLMG